MRILKKEDFLHQQLQSKSTNEQYSLCYVISEALKSKQLFFHHDIIAPSKRSSAPHRHTHIEEVLYIIKENVTIIYNDQKQIVEKGSFILFDPIETNFHYLFKLELSPN